VKPDCVDFFHPCGGARIEEEVLRTDGEATTSPIGVRGLAHRS